MLLILSIAFIASYINISFSLDILQVCGTDGVTYENICELRTQSNNARLDYRGRCVDDDNSTAGQVCRRVIMSGRCRFNTSNCPCLVRPVVGCCPVCGKLQLEFVTYNYYQSLQVELYWHYWIGRGLVMPVC